MAKKTIKLPGFGIGLLIGSFITALYFKKKYDCITVHIDEEAKNCPDVVEPKCSYTGDCTDTDADCEDCPCTNCESGYSSCDTCSVK